MPDNHGSGFHDVSFPLHLAFGASGGPQRAIEITQLASGAEKRNSRNAHSRRRYNATLGIKTYAQAVEIISFFEARFGSLYAFRFKDKLDYRSSSDGEATAPTDQVIGMGDGVQTEFQLVKTYGDVAHNYVRRITKPVADTVQMAVNGGGILSADYTVDYLTGLVTFNSAPITGAVITAGFEFDVPVRFDMERLDVSLDDFEAVHITDIPLIEVLYHV